MGIIVFVGGSRHLENTISVVFIVDVGFEESQEFFVFFGVFVKIRFTFVHLSVGGFKQEKVILTPGKNFFAMAIDDGTGSAIMTIVPLRGFRYACMEAIIIEDCFDFRGDGLEEVQLLLPLGDGLVEERLEDFHFRGGLGDDNAPIFNFDRTAIEVDDCGAHVMYIPILIPCKSFIDRISIGFPSTISTIPFNYYNASAFIKVFFG